MNRNALALAFVGLMTAAGTASATLSVPNASPTPGATDQSAPISYAARTGINGANFAVVVTNGSAAITNIRFQARNGAGTWLDCSGASLPQADFNTTITCSAAGVYQVDAAAGDLAAQSNNMRVLYDVSGSATDGQTATVGFGPYCTGTQTPAANSCTAYFLTATTLRDDAPAMPVSTDGTVTVTVSANRTLAFNPTFGTTISFGPGAVGSTPSQNIVVTASGNVGTATVTGCAISGSGASSFSVSPTSLTFSGATANPQNLAVGCTIPASSASATLTCTQTDQGGTATPRTWPLTCAAVNANPVIAESPATGSTLSVGGAQAGSQATTSVTLTATGGSGAGTASVACTSTGGVQIAFGATPTSQAANQTVTGANPAQNLVVGATLTPVPQTGVGTVTCDVTDNNGTRQITYSVDALAGVVPPEIIPASSLWSQLALIALFLGLGGLVLVVRRNG